jgi:surface carbohydrate biosynthesis protein
MKRFATPLIIPVENQVRELDAKILLSCIAAERGFPVFLGSRGYLHYKMAAMPRGVYLAKSMRKLSNKMFRIIRCLGHEIIAWDEEALVHPPADIYFPLRLSPVTVPLVSHLICWGQENADLLRQYPQLPQTTPIHIAGNPRGDMLRPELRGYFDDQVKKLQEQYGDFILVNTNFSDVNPFIPGVGLFIPDDRNGEPPRFGQAGKGMTLEFATGLRDHKLEVLDAFLQMLPALHQAFPDDTIVIRPHPSENHDVYNKLAVRFKNIKIDNSGNIIPWLLACKVMIHNGCTTGAEAYLLRVPAISYLASFNKNYDYDWQGLPTKLSYQCFSYDELKLTLAEVLSGKKTAAGGEERKLLIDHYLTAQEGPLACERLIDVLMAAGYDQQAPLPPSALSRTYGWLKCNLRKAQKQVKMNRPGSTRQSYHDHRFPELTVTDIEQRIERFRKQLNRFDSIKVSAHSRHIFNITN